MRVSSRALPESIADFRKPRKPARESLPQDLEQSTPQDTVLLADNGSTISEILFHYPTNKQEHNEPAFIESARAVVKELACQLTGDPKVWLAMDSATEKPNLEGVDTEALHLGEKSYIWARDGATAAKDNEGNPTLILSRRKSVRKNIEVADKALDLLSQKHPNLKIDLRPNVTVEDGQRVANSKHVFLSEEAVKSTAWQLMFEARESGTEESVIEAYEAKNGVEVLPEHEISPQESLVRDTQMNYWRAGNRALEGIIAPAEQHAAARAFEKERAGEFTKMLQSPPDQIGESKLVSRNAMWNDLAVEQLELAYGPFVRIGEDFQDTLIREGAPKNHIDLVMTPLGENRMLVGSTSMALELLDSLSDEEKALYNQRLSQSVGEESDYLNEYQSLLGENPNFFSPSGSYPRRQGWTQPGPHRRATRWSGIRCSQGAMSC